MILETFFLMERKRLIRAQSFQDLLRDQDWGCRLTLLVDEDARDQVPRISRMLEEGLPERFGEFPVRFPVTWDSSVSHKVEVATVADFATSHLGANPARGHDPAGRA